MVTSGCTCNHPLFLFNQFGDLERCSLRPGNVHSADGWSEVLEPVVERYRERNLRRYFRGDAAFAAPDIYEFLESEGFLYAIRLPKNQILQESIAHLLTRPVGRPPNHVRRYYASFRYQAGSWDRKRRVVAKVEWHPGELCPRVGFIVTNLSRPGPCASAGLPPVRPCLPARASKPCYLWSPPSPAFLPQQLFRRAVTAPSNRPKT